jgi:hypothetical protein
MGVKFGREYAAIISEFAQALGPIEEMCVFLGMDAGEWEVLGDTGRFDCIRTIADDLFYALGTEKEVSVGPARIVYDELHHRIRVYYADGSDRDISLIDRE